MIDHKDLTPGYYWVSGPKDTDGEPEIAEYRTHGPDNRQIVFYIGTELDYPIDNLTFHAKITPDYIAKVS